jgi:hypothetical protein
MRNGPVDRRLCIRGAWQSKLSAGIRDGADHNGGDHARAAFEFLGHVHGRAAHDRELSRLA